MRSVSDYMLTSVEVYNPGPHAIDMVRDISKDEYVKLNGIAIGPLKAELAPKTRVLLPHQFYASFYKGSKELAINGVLAIFGNDIGKGVTTASRPEVTSKVY